MIGIVILNYNSWDLTLDCVESITQTCSENYHVFIVDNNSSIDMPKHFKEYINNEKIDYIQSFENKGYSAGNNLGIKRALDYGCSYILISNSDVIFKEKTIETMRVYLEKNKNVGIVGPKVFLSNGQIQDIDMLVKTTLKIKYKNMLFKTPFPAFFKIRNEFSRDKENLDLPFKVHSVSGCCFMMNRLVTENVYPLDEIPFLYEEEIILGVQMEKLGLDTVYLTSAEIIHFHGQTTKNVKAFSYIEFVRSEIYYLKRYMYNTNIQILPLIVIRFTKYLVNCSKSADYRMNFKKFFSRGLEFMRRGDI